LKEANPFSLKNLPYTIAGVLIPMGAMKLITMDADQLANMVRFEWQLDEEVIEAAESQSVKTPGSTGEPAVEPPPTQELKVGDVIPTPEGNQTVVKIESGRITTERPVRTTTTPGAPAGRDTPLSGTPGSQAASGHDSVWVQLTDGRVRAFRPHEVEAANFSEGTPATTPEGPGRIASSSREPPSSGSVLHNRDVPYLSPDQLNEPIQVYKGGARRTLTSAEKSSANRVQDVLKRYEFGDEAAGRELTARYRRHSLTGDLAGWESVDVLPNASGYYNEMRIVFRPRPTGGFDVRLIQMH
jgi:hypothetical protein